MKLVTKTTLGLAAAAAFATTANAATIGIVEAYGHNEKENYGGKIDDMSIGSGMNSNGNDGVAGWPTTDPSTWTATSNAYQAEWQSQDLLAAQTPAEDLDANGNVVGDGVAPGTNGKIGWAAFDLGASTAGLENLYIWHIRENNQRYAATFNVYVADSPTAALVHGPTGNNSRDYDFSSGGWAQIGGTLNGSFQGTQTVALGGITGRYIGLEILSNNGHADRVGFAEVGVTANPIPEPSAFVLFGLGGLGLLLRRRRKA